MSWFGETNPHFWSSSSNQRHTPAAPPSPPRPQEPPENIEHVRRPTQQPPENIQPVRRPAHQPPENIQPVRVTRPRHHHAPEPNPHFWPRDRRQAPGAPSGLADIKPEKRRPKERLDQEPNPPFWPKDRHPSPPNTQPIQQPPTTDIQPEKRTKPKQRPSQVQPPLVQESNPHLWPRDPPQALTPLTKSHGHAPQPGPRAGHEPELELIPTRSTHPSRQHEPHEPNPHLWPRDQPQAPVGPTLQPHPPQAHEPELETWPTRPEDRSPIHPTEASQEHWPLHPEQGSQELSDGQQRRQPKKQQPRIGSTKTRPPRKHDRQEQPFKDQNLMYPAPNRTNPCTWFIAIFCVILWVVVILGGILILIIYLFYRPRNPHFEIPNANLNAAYLDMGYLLNADLVVLINITNPNHKMNLGFNFANLKLKYENQPIANQYVGSFSIPNSESKFATLEMVSSQIRLPVLITQQLVKQIKNNRVTFQVEGHFHVSSSMGAIFRYSYWIYSYCTIVTTGPPSGTMVASKCIIKR